MPEGQTYTFTVQPANCGGELRGPESDPVTVSLQGAYFVTLISATGDTNHWDWLAISITGKIPLNAFKVFVHQQVH